MYELSSTTQSALTEMNYPRNSMRYIETRVLADPLEFLALCDITDRGMFSIKLSVSVHF